MHKLKFLLFITLIISCGYNRGSNITYSIVKEYKCKNDNLCVYDCSSDGATFLSGNGFRFIDSCGKFNIGDTIKIVK